MVSVRPADFHSAWPYPVMLRIVRSYRAFTAPRSSGQRIRLIRRE
jgi:hypothetical protein